MRNQDYVRYQRSRELHRRVIRGATRCDKCKTPGFWELSRRDGRIVCYRCRTGIEWEVHHVAGLGRGPRFVVPSNSHRLFSEQQNGWPARLRDHGRSPELEQFATVRGLAELGDQFDGWPMTQFEVRANEPIKIPLSQIASIRQVFGTDEAWYRPNQDQKTPWRPMPLDFPD